MKLINLFGGPGVSKSTHAAGIFYKLKSDGYNSEYIQEYAKGRTWGKDFNTLKFQPYVTGKQWFSIARLMEPEIDGMRSQVDVAVTDSPIITGLLYQGFGCTPAWQQWVWDAFNMFDNINFLLIRNSAHHPYNAKGRSQTESESMTKDIEIKHILDSKNVPYHTIEVGSNSLDEIYTLIMKQLRG